MRSLADVERKLSGILRAIEDGAYNATLKSRLTALESEKSELERRFSSLKPAPVIRLHPNLPDGNLSVVAEFAQAGERTGKNAGPVGDPALLSLVAGGGFEPPTFRL